MAMLKKARFFRGQTQAENDVLVNKLIYQASIAYFEWLEAVNERNIYSNFLLNASERFLAIKQSVEVGDKAAIDSVEAKITLSNRQLGLEAAILKSRKVALKVSNFLWMNDTPLELQDDMIPLLPNQKTLNTLIVADSILVNTNDIIRNHPKN